MAIPVSGSIGLRSTPQTCGNICVAVYQGQIVEPMSLTNVSVAAQKAAPHGMLEFYGYVPQNAYFFTQATAGTDNVSAGVSGLYCVCRSPAGNTNTVCVTIDVQLKALAQAAGSYASVGIYCNTTQVYYCSIAADGNVVVTAPTSGFYLMGPTTTLCMCLIACTTNTLCSTCSSAMGDLNILNPTAFVDGTPSTINRYTG